MCPCSSTITGSSMGVFCSLTVHNEVLCVIHYEEVLEEVETCGTAVHQLCGFGGSSHRCFTQQRACLGRGISQQSAGLVSGIR